MTTVRVILSTPKLRGFRSRILNSRSPHLHKAVELKLFVSFLSNKKQCMILEYRDTHKIKITKKKRPDADGIQISQYFRIPTRIHSLT